MFEALSATAHLGRLLGRSSLSCMSRSTTAAIFSPVCLSEKGEQKGVHLQRNSKSFIIPSFLRVPMKAEQVIDKVNRQGNVSIQAPAGPQVGRYHS